MPLFGRKDKPAPPPAAPVRPPAAAVARPPPSPPQAALVAQPVQPAVARSAEPVPVQPAVAQPVAVQPAQAQPVPAPAPPQAQPIQAAVAPLPPPPSTAAPQRGDTVVSAGEFQIETGTPEVGAQTQMERMDNVERVLKGSELRIETLEKLTESIKTDINQIKDSITEIQGNMRELTSLYDLISSQVNPFIDSELAGKGIAPPGEEGKEGGAEFDALFEPTPEMGVGEKGEEVSIEGGAPQEGQVVEVIATQPGVAAQPGVMAPLLPVAPLAPSRVVRLTQIGSDSMCYISMVRWIEFMLAKVKREQIPGLLTYYVRIGWVSESIRSHVLDMIRGMRAGPGAPGAAAGAVSVEAPRDKEGDVVMAYSKEAFHGTAKPAEPGGKKPVEDDWKLAPEDHLKSLIFIERIRGSDIDKNKLQELEEDIKRLRGGLEGFFGL